MNCLLLTLEMLIHNFIVHCFFKVLLEVNFFSNYSHYIHFVLVCKSRYAE